MASHFCLSLLILISTFPCFAIEILFSTLDLISAIITQRLQAGGARKINQPTNTKINTHTKQHIKIYCISFTKR